ncbi:ABC transporter substrate-binding protein [Paracoccus contaminans]|uniref:ABC transporter substrate-binding protein n=1 Tax=Paracoccus contaminans TaxID=1945662 RepID=A0A1W6CVR8_9RHOB|nr:ABC transporter substrate-binding protein [Paracoccus contaminans]ARJ68978.1 ABC transporter substrate-binding protein [Paracoccus contaminans]
MIHRPLRRRALMTALAAATLAAAIPAGASAAEAVDLGVLRLTSHAPSFIAYERGYFRDEGLDVTMQFFEAAQPMSVAVAAGDVDYGMTAITGGLISLAEKGALKVIGGALSESPGVPGAMILASNAAYADGLTDPSKIAGRSFGTTTAGSSFHYMLNKVAEANHIPMADIRMRPLQKVGAIVGALTSGQIDGWIIQPSIGNGLVAEGHAKKIGDFNAIDPNYQVTVVFSSAAMAKDQRATTEAFLRALARGAHDYNAAFVDHSADAAEIAALDGIVHKYVQEDLPDADFAQMMATTSMRINDGLALSMGSITDQLEWFKREGMVSPDITSETLVDSSFVQSR